MSPVALLRLGALGLAVLAGCSTPRPTEFVNITFTPSVDTDHYATWDFDLDKCVDFDDPRADSAFIREHLLAEIQRILEARGLERRTGQPVDFTVFYELWLTDGGDLAGVEERARGKIIVRDGATGQFVWRGERKAPAAVGGSPEELLLKIHRFAQELLQYIRKLEDPEQQD